MHTTLIPIYYFLLSVSIDTVLSLDVFKKGALFASCAKVSAHGGTEMGRNNKSVFELFIHGHNNICLWPFVCRIGQCACGTWTVTVVRCDVWHRAPATLMLWDLSHAPGNPPPIYKHRSRLPYITL